MLLRIPIIEKSLLRVALYWFKAQAGMAAKAVLSPAFKNEEIQRLLHGYWQRYLRLRREVPPMPTFGGSLMLHLAAMSAAFYQELTVMGETKDAATRSFYDIAWKVYKKMGGFSWWLASLRTGDPYRRLRIATELFRAFPFNSPSYLWKDVQASAGIVAFDCLRCPVAEYFQSKGLSEFCTETWCKLDFPLAERWHARLDRSGTIAGGAKVCDFRWKTDSALSNMTKGETPIAPITRRK